MMTKNIMADNIHEVSSGLPGLDKVLQGIIPGDNVVWQVDSIDYYQEFITPLYNNALSKGHRIVYFRFAKHSPLIPENVGADIYTFRPEDGFEAFITHIHNVISRKGHGGYYVFDSLSQLALDCYSDRMVGNFFMLTCPYILHLEAVAYFAVLRNYHSFHAASPISETTQILIDVYNHNEKLYIHPLKVSQRYSPTIYTLHAWEGDEFIPVTHSAVATEVMASAAGYVLETASYQMGVWNRMFLQAEEILDAHRQGECSKQKVDEVFNKLLRMSITREERLLDLARRYFELSDILEIRKRMNGTGFIGGKSVGMLLARAILTKKDSRWEEKLEAHDSFYIGSDVFYTYLVLNDCWWLRKKQKDPATFLDVTEEAQQRIMNGTFPNYIIKRFEDMLDYFGQSPIIVRSSSLMEDNFGNTFAGKYESVFCANQCSRKKRLENFMNAVRIIYASSMSEEALTYRERRGLLDQDEQMALLVQRVSGDWYNNFFYPQISGVGISYNPYAWSNNIDPEAGVLRIVFGLGTRAVERTDDDYTRIVALNNPNLRPESGRDEIRRYTQRKVDVLDQESNQQLACFLEDVVKQSKDLPFHYFSSRDEELEQIARGIGKKDIFTSSLSFQTILNQTPLVQDLRDILQTLEEAYVHPVDIEFTVNFFDLENYKINLLQCRPVQRKGSSAIEEPSHIIKDENLLLKSSGSVIGHSRAEKVDRIIYVVSSVYGELPINDRYSIARLIGKLTRLERGSDNKKVMLIGPGRWGTSTPSLGIPVSFAEISSASIICEIVEMRENLIPDVSLGTHFFSNLVELDMLYMAIHPQKEENFLNQQLLLSFPNQLEKLLPDTDHYKDAVKVIDFTDSDGHPRFLFNANTLKQKAVGYLES